MEELLKLIVMGVSIGVSVFATVSLAFAIIARLHEQKQLYKSIQLLQLKSFKLHYIVFMVITFALVLYLIGQTLDRASPEYRFFAKNLGFSRGEFIIVSIFVEVFLLVASTYFSVLAFAKSAVVDKGLYLGSGFVEWNEIYDYVVNEKSSRVIFTLSRESFSTMRGTTPPYKVLPEDMSKLVFILNKNKNRFN
ncbi:MAG: hypothetical protein IJD07_03010 [Clostridia bacterium]|nr:hypothetical protein [Clostridia bacterium]